MVDQVKSLLGLTDESKDELLKQIVGIVEKRLKLKLGGVDTIPAELEYIVVEVSVSRYNRISSEGTTSHSLDGTSYTWVDDDFTPYLNDIEDWLKKNSGRGKVRFL